MGTARQRQDDQDDQAGGEKEASPQRDTEEELVWGPGPGGYSTPRKWCLGTQHDTELEEQATMGA